MTLEAWVNPTGRHQRLAGRDRKGQRQLLPHGDLDSRGRRPSRGRHDRRGLRHDNASRRTRGRTWPLPTTRPRSVSTSTAPRSRPSPNTANLTTSTNALTIGSDPFYGQYFSGLIDEVRIYNTALTSSQIQTDMVTPVVPQVQDPTPPTVAISSPAAGAQLSDIVNVTADASDNVGVAGVQFFVDGVASGLEDPDSPYGLAWDTRTVSNGAHTLTARARDAAGNLTTSAPVTVNVANANHFQNEVLATGFTLPTNIEFLPDGRMLVVELAGTIKVLPPPYTQPDPTPFLQLTNVGSAGVQQGIYDIALDPAFTTNHYYYVFYTAGSPNRDRLSRFTANASLTGTVAGSELVLYQDPQNANAEHHGGAINFGNDGKLYFTTGEHFNAGDAQLLTSPRGKIHRINKDGTVPTDNPFYDGSGPKCRLDLGARASQPVPRLLRRPDRQALHRRCRRQRLLDREGGGEPRRRRRQLRLAELRGKLRRAVHRSHLLLSAQRARRRSHRWVRLSRHPVPERVPGGVLLRRLHPELDQVPDLRHERQGERCLQLRACRRNRRRALRRHRLSDRRPRRGALLRRSRLLGHQRHVSASARSGESGTCRPTRRRSRWSGRTPPRERRR